MIRTKFPLDHTVYFDKGDGRLIFAIPRNNTVYVGTTDTIHSESADHLNVTEWDVNYIMEAIAGKFTKLDLSTSDILSTWVGVRPLIYEEGKDVTEISRKDEIFIADSGLITIAGGKLTGYRHMAMDIIDQFIDELDGDYSECKTENIKLTKKPFKNTKAVEQAVKEMARLIDNSLVPEWVAPYLIYNYGNASFEIIDNVPDNDINLETITIAELAYTIENESVRTLLDFYERRTGRLYFEINSILPTLDSVADKAGKILGWDKAKIQSEIASMRQAVSNQTHFIKTPIEA